MENEANVDLVRIHVVLQTGCILSPPLPRSEATDFCDQWEAFLCSRLPGTLNLTIGGDRVWSLLPDDISIMTLRPEAEVREEVANHKRREEADREVMESQLRRLRKQDAEDSWKDGD